MHSLPVGLVETSVGLQDRVVPPDLQNHRQSGGLRCAFYVTRLQRFFGTRLPKRFRGSRVRRIGYEDVHRFRFKEGRRRPLKRVPSVRGRWTVWSEMVHEGRPACVNLPSKLERIPSSSHEREPAIDGTRSGGTNDWCQNGSMRLHDNIMRDVTLRGCYRRKINEGSLVC